MEKKDKNNSRSTWRIQ